MTTSPKTQLKLNDKGRIVLGQLGYARQKLRSRAHNLLHSEMKAHELTQSEISIMSGKNKSSLSRLLGAPNNLTLDTLSDLILAITGKEVALSLLNPSSAPKTNYDTNAWLEDRNAADFISHITVEGFQQEDSMEAIEQPSTASAKSRSDHSDSMVDYFSEVI